MIRMTNQRKVILEELKKHIDHPTADELYVQIRKVLPKISLGTVYRNLDQMSTNGTIAKIEGSGQKRFDPNPLPHPHFRCIKCGSIEDIHENIPAPVIDSQGNFFSDRKVSGFNLEFYGECSACI